MRLHAEILKKNGKSEFAIMPYEEFVAIREALNDLEDLRTLRRAKAREGRSPTLSLKQVRLKLGLTK